MPVGKRILCAVMFFGGCFALLTVLPPLFMRIINAGTLIGVLGGGMLIFAALVGRVVNTGRRRVLYRVYLALIALLIGYAGYLSVKMIGSCLDSPHPNSGRTAIVLGCQVYDSGPSVMLKNRLDAALEFLDSSPRSVCIVSGGKGEGEPVTEAEAMKEYLVSNGIEPSRIFTEDKSLSTEENLAFSKQVMEENGMPAEAVIITDGFHMLRARMLAEKQGIDALSFPSATPLHLLPVYWYREWAGVTYTVLFS